MVDPSPPPGRGPRERVQAWLLLGPIGHLWSVTADISVFASASLAGRARRALPRRRDLSAGTPRPRR